MIDDLLAFLRASPTPFHAVDQARRRLEAHGFRALDEAEPWDQLAPGAYAVTSSGSNLFAFVLPEAREHRRRFCLVGAHTDSPNLRIKPCLLYTSDAADERSSVDLGGRRI